MRKKNMAFGISYGLLWFASLVIVSHYKILNFASLCFLVVSGCSALYLLFRNSFLSQQKLSWHCASWLLAFYYCFALFGRKLFMQDARFALTLQRIIGFIILAIVLYPTTPGILALLEKASQRKICPNNSIRINVKTGLLCGSVVFVADGLLTLGFYPCTMTNDSLTHWQQATGQIAMSDYSPIAFNLLLKGLFTVSNNRTPYPYVLFQIVLLSVVIGNICCYLNRRGVQVRMLFFGSLLFAVCPSTYMQLLYLSKNPLTAILCLWVTLSIIEAITDSETYLKRPIWYIKTVLAISGLYFARENNVVIAIPLIIFTVWFLISHRKKGKRILFVVAGVICFIALMQGGVYKRVSFVHADKNHETIRPLLAPIGSALQQELPLPDDIVELAERVLPLNEWKERYDPFSSDPITWGTPRPQYGSISLSSAFSAYLKMLVTYPDVVLKDRLDGMNLIWDIRAEVWRCPTNIHEKAVFQSASFLENGIIGKVKNELRGVAHTLFVISGNEEILDIMVWKNGIYIYLLMVVAIFVRKQKAGKLLWAILPSIFILLTYVLVIAWQMYFYIWFFPLTVTLLIIVAVVDCRQRMIG